MKRRIQGLSETTQVSADAVPDGVFLVRVDRAQYLWHPAKPFYILRLSVLEPHELAGRVISGRVYCTAKALWKLGWFLRDFLYDPDLLGREEVDEKALAGLRGDVKISHTTVNGTTGERIVRIRFHLLERFTQYARVRTRQHPKNPQIKSTQSLPRGNHFPA